MGQKTEKRTIGGLEYSTTQLPAMKALALSTRIGRAVGPALAAASGVDMGADVAALAPAITRLFASLDGAEAQALTKEILQGTTVVFEGKHVHLGDTAAIDHVFTGRLGELFTVVKFALEVNFTDFFDALTSAASAKLGAGASATKANG